MKYPILFLVTLVFLVAVIIPVYAAKPYFPESIKIGEKTPFSLKMSNLREDRISDIEPIITIMPKSASEFVHVDINPQISTLWDGFYEITHGTIQVDKGIPVDRIFVSVSFMGKNPFGEQVPLSSDSTFNASIKIEKESLNADSIFDLEKKKPNCSNPNSKTPLYGCSYVVTVKIDSPLKQFKSGVQIDQIQCKAGLELVIKSSDGSPICVKHGHKSKLLERGSAFDSYETYRKQPKIISDAKNNTGIIAWRNQDYYFETPHYTDDVYGGKTQISFHDVIFTLSPQPFSGGLPVGGCGGSYYWADAKFSDSTNELLHMFVNSKPCSDNSIPITLSNHTNPQAGLAFFDGRMRLLVSSDSSEYLNKNTVKSSLNCAGNTSNEFTLGKIFFQIPERLVFFVKANSSAQLCVRYTSGLPNNGTLPAFPQVYTGSDSTTYNTSTDIDITVQPTEIPLEQGSDTIVTYTVSAHDKTGVYWLFAPQFCELIPVVVWSDTPDVSPLDIPLSTGVRNCPLQYLDAKIVGSEGGILDYRPTLIIPRR